MRKILTISLSSFDFLQEALEPAEGRSVAANPKEFNPAKRAQVTTALTIPDVLEDRRKRRHTWRTEVSSVPISGQGRITHRYQHRQEQQPPR
jgi:hypothetical protein